MKTIKFLHKWVSLILAIQCFIWLGSGLYFNLMDSKKVSGNQYRVSKQENKSFDKQKIIEPSQVLQKLPKDKNIYNLKLISLLGKPYYLMNEHKALYPHQLNEHQLINAISGENTVINQTFAQSIALATYTGKGRVISIKQQLPPIDGFYKEENTLWEVNIDDDRNTSIYLDASSGRLVGHVNDDKRFADFFFMLHFMDYGLWETSRTGLFNNGVIIMLGFLMLLLCLTGCIWVVDAFRMPHRKKIV